ncbi:MAG: ATP-binding protein [Deltaproteobacteria bacterium]|nr:ATP-binding protein [Deltaproteobacteria bacterium]
MIGRDVSPLKNRSYFLFGPRGVGKSTWLQNQYSENEIIYLDLLDPDLYEDLLFNPGRFQQIISSPENLKKIVVVDEVQKLPKLLDVVHLEIQRKKRQFILTGSSSRKLKQKGVNLLAGRASVYHLFPLSSLELKDQFNLQRALEWGGLPDAYLASPPDSHVNDALSREYLSAYALTYLEKEIQQEQWVRKIEPFRKFLMIASRMNGKIINRSRIARDVGVDDMTIASYYEILEDTLIGFSLPAFHRSARKSQRQASKFYLVDTGIKRALDKSLMIPLQAGTAAYGEAFEHWLILELYKVSEYHRLDWRFYYARTPSDVEVDLIIERPGKPRLFIEIKSKNRIDESDAKSLETLAADLDSKGKRLLLSQDPLDQTFGKTKAMHWQTALQEIIKDKI